MLVESRALKTKPGGRDLLKSLSGDLGHTKKPLIKAERHPDGNG